MLVLTRKPGETIVLKLPTGEVVQVVVINIDHSRVRVGVEAPKDVVILRGELYADQT
jgi:carbon storage regulator